MSYDQVQENLTVINFVKINHVKYWNVLTKLFAKL